MTDQIKDLKGSFVSFNRDFIKLSEYFFNFKGAEQNFINNNGHKSFVDDNNMEFVRGSAVPNLDHDDIVNIRNNDISVYEKGNFYNLTLYSRKHKHK